MIKQSIKKIITQYIFVGIMLILSLQSCVNVNKLRDEFEITSYEFKSVSPHGFRSVDGVVNLGINNPVSAIKLWDITGVLKYKGQELADFKVDPVKLVKRSNQKYDLMWNAALSKQTSIFDLMKFTNGANLDDFTADVKFKVRSGLLSKKFNLKDLPLKRLIKYGIKI